MKRSKIKYELGTAFGAFLLVGGLFLALDAWSTMQQIQAQGIVGQAFNQEEYKSASRNLQIFGTASVFGFAMMILSVGEYIVDTLKELSG